MSKLFIRTDGDGRVTFIHNLPFDPQYGLHKSEQELAQEGYLVDSIPEQPSDLPEDKQAALYYDGAAFRFELTDAPMTPEREMKKLQKQLEQQERVSAQLLYEVVNGGGANA